MGHTVPAKQSTGLTDSITKGRTAWQTMQRGITKWQLEVASAQQ